ncbi:MAG: TonB-dependent receptor [Undibacterium sp.]|nr:TonB-dependent receptor [Opitutaceae bacterium]
MIGLGLLTPLTLGAADTVTRSFDVPTGEARVTLKLFAAQAGGQVLYSPDDVSGIATHAVSGEFTPLDALTQMLAQTPLKARQDTKTKAIAITTTKPSRAPPSPPQPPAARPPEPPKTSQSKSLDSPAMKPRILLSVISAWLLTAGTADAQTASGSAVKSETIKLTPFEVVGDTGDAYGTTMSNSVTMFQTDLSKLPVSADIMTSQFMRDLDIQNLDQLVSGFATGSGWGSVQNDTDALPKDPGVRVANTEVKLRGVGSGTIRRDGLIAANNSAFSDGFATESIEILKGPNALLYSGSAGGGVISAVSKQARFGRNSTSLSYRIDSFGSKRGELDFSRTFRTKLRLLPEIAVRTSLMKQREEFYRDGYGNNAWGAYTQFAFRLPRSTLRVGYMHSEALNWVGYSPGFSYRSNRPATGAWDPSPAVVARHTGINGAIPSLSVGDLYAEGEGPRIANGRLSLRNLNSAFVSDYNHNPKDDYVIASLETRWSRHISSLITFAADKNPVDMQYQGAGSLFPAGYTNIEKLNPVAYDPSTPIGDYSSTIRSTTTDWTVVSPAPEFYEQHFRRKAFRPALGIEWSNFGGKLKHNAIVGYELNQLKADFDLFNYFLADSNGKVLVNPATVANTNTNGRIMLRNEWYEVGQQGINFQRINPLETKSVTLNGQNWVLQSQNFPGLVPSTPSNPRGLRPATATGGALAGHQFVSVETSSFFGALQTDWFNDRVQSVASVRRETYSSSRWDYRVLTGQSREETNWSGNLGINIRATNGLRPYVNYSLAAAPPSANATFGPFGELVPLEKSKGWESGAKFNIAGKIDGSISYFAADIKGKNTANGLVLDANPNGLNGRRQPSDQWYGVDQKTNGYELMLSGAPVTGWRTTLRVGVQDGRVGTQLDYPMLYNDQFYTNAAGEVTYQNGTVVTVNPTSVVAVASGGIPLTVAMLNDSDPTNIYYWDPNPRNGTTMNGNVSNLLRNPGAAFVTANGPIATGNTGLPASARQVAWDDPLGFNDGIEISRAGRKTIGYARYKLSFTNTYNFRSGWLKAFSIGGLVNVELENRNRWIRWPIAFDRRNRIVKTTDDTPAAQMPRVNLPGRYYYTSQGLLWGLPDNYVFNGWATYSRKFGRDAKYRFSSQVNVNNVFNRAPILANPFSGSIYGETRGFVQQNQPRTWSWTNRIDF